MPLDNFRMIKDPDRSFILHHETHSFSSWHYHPEFELTLILNGKGRRLIGDNIDRFRNNDLILIGSGLPHAWICDDYYNNQPGGFRGEAIVLQFTYEFLGPQFFEVPENKKLKLLLEKSSRGIMFTGKTKEKIISILHDSYSLSGSDQFFMLMTLFNIFSVTKDYQLLASMGFVEPYHKEGNEPVQKAIDHILHNFHQHISIKDMLNITNMSNTTFCIAFKRITRMKFKEYLLHIRTGYACKLLTNTNMTIAQIASSSGFENLSNFNHKFKRLKGLTPSAFRKKADSLKVYPN
jgi:AraC-like DNA-binding protein